MYDAPNAVEELKQERGGTELGVKIYRTKDGQNFSLEPILNDGVPI